MIGIIGGSGFYSFLEESSEREISTPFGKVIYHFGKIEDKEIVFIPRHGATHSITPSQINYRANIYAAHLLNITKIYTTNAVGTSDREITPGSFVVLDQIIDFTSGRKSTFFDDGNFSVTLSSGERLSGVVHTDVSTPFDKKIRKEIIQATDSINEEIQNGGTIAVVNGPRYETPAEIKAYTILGANYFGMTSSPEAFLAKELQIPYATLAVVTNYAAGMQSKITHEEVAEIFNNRINVVKNIFRHAIINY